MGAAPLCGGSWSPRRSCASRTGCCAIVDPRRVVVARLLLSVSAHASLFSMSLARLDARLVDLCSGDFSAARCSAAPADRLSRSSDRHTHMHVVAAHEFISTLGSRRWTRRWSAPAWRGDRRTAACRFLRACRSSARAPWHSLAWSGGPSDVGGSLRGRGPAGASCAELVRGLAGVGCCASRPATASRWAGSARCSGSRSPGYHAPLRPPPRRQVVGACRASWAHHADRTAEAFEGSAPRRLLRILAGDPEAGATFDGTMTRLSQGIVAGRPPRAASSTARPASSTSAAAAAISSPPSRTG